MKLQTGRLPKSLWFKCTLFGVMLLGETSAWAQFPVPPGPGGSPIEYVLADVQISLQRTECFGLCPVYEVRIGGDGNVVYEGEDHVRLEGMQEASIDKAAVFTLLEKIYHARFFEMRDGYYGQSNFLELEGKIVVFGESNTTDLPSQIVTVRIGDYEKRVVDYVGSPVELVELVELIDQVSGVRQWVECDRSNGSDGYCL
jgi:hypothetical protein